MLTQLCCNRLNAKVEAKWGGRERRSDRLRSAPRGCHSGQGVDALVEVSTSLYTGNSQLCPFAVKNQHWSPGHWPGRSGQGDRTEWGPSLLAQETMLSRTLTSESGYYLR